MAVCPEGPEGSGIVSVRTIRKNDVVVANVGKNKGKSGKVLRVDAERGRVLVEGVNIVKKTLKKSQENPQGGIVPKEAPISISNVALLCPTCKKGVKVRREKDGERSVRKCKKCGHAFEG